MSIQNDNPHGTIDPVRTIAAAEQCIDLLRRFPWIEEKEVPAPEGIELMVRTYDKDGDDLGDLGVNGTQFIILEKGYTDRSFTHWFPMPRQPRGSNWIDSNDRPKWIPPRKGKVRR